LGAHLNFEDKEGFIMRAWHSLKRFLQRYTSLIIIAIIVVLALIWILSSLKLIPELWATILSTVFIALALVFAVAQWRPSFKSTKAREKMDDDINEYESIRHHTPPGNERNSNMEKVMMGMQSQAQQADYSPQEIRRYLGFKREGGPHSWACYLAMA
jgi:preprotein translocase subunit SecG